MQANGRHHEQGEQGQRREDPENARIAAGQVKNLIGSIIGGNVTWTGHVKIRFGTAIAGTLEDEAIKPSTNKQLPVETGLINVTLG